MDGSWKQVDNWWVRYLSVKVTQLVVSFLLWPCWILVRYWHECWGRLVWWDSKDLKEGAKDSYFCPLHVCQANWTCAWYGWWLMVTYTYICYIAILKEKLAIKVFLWPFGTTKMKIAKLIGRHLWLVCFCYETSYKIHLFENEVYPNRNSPDCVIHPLDVHRKFKLDSKFKCCTHNLMKAIGWNIMCVQYFHFWIKFKLSVNIKWVYDMVWTIMIGIVLMP